MDDDTRRVAFLTALTAEHSNLSMAINTAITEAGSRATALMLTVSSAMVALGFTVDSPEAFWPFASAVLPLLFAMGFLTSMRLVDTGVQILMFQQAIARIRQHYRSLETEKTAYFIPFARDPQSAAVETLTMQAVRGHPEVFSFAAATALLTAAIGGIGVALLVARLTDLRLLIGGAGIGIVITVGLMAAFVAYQRARYRSVLSS
jgi:hypothetical protein